MNMQTMIRPVDSSDHNDWLRMWTAYLEFYEQELSEETTATTWKALLKPAGHDCLVAVDSDTRKLVGFVTYLFHASTWTQRGYCYLEDLYVVPESRRHGTGTCLINAVVDVARSRKVSRVYWHTDQENATAQHLYRKVAKQSGMLQFRISTES